MRERFREPRVFFVDVEVTCHHTSLFEPDKSLHVRSGVVQETPHRLRCE